MKSFAYAVFLLGMIAPVIWEPLVYEFSRRFNPYRTYNLPPLSAGYAAGSAAPFVIAGWLLSYSLKDKSLVWQQRCIISFSTTVLGVIFLIISRPVVERLFH